MGSGAGVPEPVHVSGRRLPARCVDVPPLLREPSGACGQGQAGLWWKFLSQLLLECGTCSRYVACASPAPSLHCRVHRRAGPQRPAAVWADRTFGMVSPNASAGNGDITAPEPALAITARHCCRFVTGPPAALISSPPYPHAHAAYRKSRCRREGVPVKHRGVEPTPGVVLACAGFATTALVPV